MTPEERSNPAILNGSRRQRIAKGSGTEYSGSKPPAETVWPDPQDDEDGDR